MIKSKTQFLLIITLFVFSIFSCEYKHDKKAHERLIKSCIQINEKIISDVNVI